MERESNPMPMCRSGCGFYGNPSQDGLCSVCFKDNLRKKQQLPVSSTPVSVTPSSVASIMNMSAAVNSSASYTSASNHSTVGASSTPDITITAQPTVHNLSHNNSSESMKDKSSDDSGECASASGESSNLDDDKDGDKDAKKKKNRCETCRKKVGLTGFECRCGGLFCAIHRYSDKHECSFDYREHGAAEIRRNNPVVVGEKIQKI